MVMDASEGIDAADAIREAAEERVRDERFRQLAAQELDVEGLHARQGMWSSYISTAPDLRQHLEAGWEVERTQISHYGQFECPTYLLRRR